MLHALAFHRPAGRLYPPLPSPSPSADQLARAFLRLTR